MLDLQQLHYFITVAELENVSQAARVLNVTQSPLSRQIQSLEDRLGFALFARSKKRLFLTAAGRVFLAEARQLISRAATLERKASGLARGDAGRLVVGSVEGAMHCGLIAEALRRMRASLPGVEIDLRVMRSGQQHDLLINREIDVGFVHTLPARTTPLHSQLLFSESFKLAVPREYGWKRSPTPAQLDGKEFIAPSFATNALARDELLRHCNAAGFRPDIKYEASSPLAALEMVAGGLGIAFMQASLVRIKPDTVSFFGTPKGFALSMPIHMVRSADLSPPASRFCAICEGIRISKSP